MTDELLVSIDGRVMTVTVNRPQARNAITEAVAKGIAEAMDELDANSDLSVAILTGAGGTFSAGMDLKGFLRGERPIVPGRGFAGVVEAPPKKPLIAAVEGYALAGGCELAIACDLIIAGKDAKFGIPEVKRGLVAAAGGLMNFPKQIPMRVAMELALTGDFLDADRAYEIGLVNRVVETGGSLEAAKALAEKIAQNAPLALAASKRIIYESRDWSRQEMFERQAEITTPVFASEDAREGAQAFAEKRPPNWKSR